MKRFTETTIWEEDWYLDLSLEYKLFWSYVKDKCNHAGIFKVNMRTFCALNEVKFSAEDFLSEINKDKLRIRDLNNGKWLIEDFIVFQYGKKLNANNRVHLSIIKLLNNNEIELSSIRGLIEVKKRSKTPKEEDKDKVKDKDKDKVKDKEVVELLDSTWVEQVGMKLKVKDVNIYLQTFLDELKLKDDLDKPTKDIKNHFVNWLKIQKEKSSPKTVNANR